MRNLLRFIINNQFIILFLLVEIVCFSLVVRYNNYQQARYINFSQSIYGYFAQKKDNLVQYLSLKEVNQQLAAENAFLKNQLESYKSEKKLPVVSVSDTTHKQQYSYIIAKIVNNSVNKQYNYITINKGSADGIEPEMAVIASDGIVGVVKSVSEHYSLIISLLNRDIKISSKLKKDNNFGSFVWSGENYRSGNLNDIPLHVKVQKGDSIVTTGYSAIFPEGIPVGIVTDVAIKGGDFFDIEAKIATDFKKLNYVYVIFNLKKQEQVSLEATVK